MVKPLVIALALLTWPALAGNTPIKNLKLTGDADANGHTILNLGPTFPADAGVASAAALEAETAARTAQDEQNAAAIAAEASDRQDAITAAADVSAAAIADEVEARETAIQQEASARDAADLLTYQNATNTAIRALNVYSQHVKSVYVRGELVNGALRIRIGD